MPLIAFQLYFAVKDILSKWRFDQQKIAPEICHRFQAIGEKHFECVIS